MNTCVIIFFNIADNVKLIFYNIADNVKCKSAPGCGKWEPSKIKNPKYKGKWRPSMIDNPDYKVSMGEKEVQTTAVFTQVQYYAL